MTTTCLHVGRAFSPTGEIRDAAILFRDGVIEAVLPRDGVVVPAGAREIVAKDRIAAPGFIDVHIHGAGGRDVMEATSEALGRIAATIGSHGTTSFVATTVTADPNAIIRSSEGIAKYIALQHQETVEGAEVLGIHFEGPFISPARRGVHPLEWIAPPSLELLDKFLSAAGGAGRILTLAPELPGALELITAARKAGMIISMGHTDATFAEAMTAVAVGAQHAAHVYNAMRPFAHREAGVVGAVLTAPGVTVELIADGIHVEEAAMRVLLAAKGPQGVILVSDGTAATGMPDGNYRLGTFEVSVAGGVPRDGEGKLAGSTLTLDRALRTIVALGVPLASALAMLTANPARLLGLQGKKGALAPGADADLVLLDSKLEIAGVMTRGVGWTMKPS
jgi:N-acetylglucosamine-6-phosphate deacetylase